METKGKIGESPVTIALGDMTKFVADAFIVPQFYNCASFGGVGGAVARAGAGDGLNAYQKFVDEKGTQKFGEAVLTGAGGGNSDYLIHVVSVGFGKENEFGVVSLAFYNALKVAEHSGLSKIAAPAMGTGVLGYLTAEQSAKAMMFALDKHAKEGGKSIDVSFVIFRDTSAVQAFATVLQNRLYESVTAIEVGQKEFDHAKWRANIEQDLALNEKAFADKHRKRNPLEPDGTNDRGI